MAPINFFLLSNGMRIAIERMEAVRSAGVTMLVPAGNAREPSDLEGLGAMWSELLLRGAGDLDSRRQADAFDRIGAGRSVNGRSLHVAISIRAMGSRLVEALDLLAAMVREPRFDAASIEPTRELALQSLASLADDPRERCALRAREHHLAPPINRSGYGTEATLRAITREDAASWWHRLARPEGTILAIAGDVDEPAVRDRLEVLLGDWAGAEEPVAIDPQGERGYHHEVDRSNQVQIDVLHDAPKAADPDAMLERCVQSVLSGGMSGRLFTEVREKRGLCYSVQSSYAPSRDFGTVAAYVGTTPERAQESLDVLLAELARINEGITREEFDRAIVGMKSRVVFGGESTAARASSIAGDIHRRGQPRTLAEIAAEIDGVTLERVTEYLGRREMGRLTIQTLGPKGLEV